MSQTTIQFVRSLAIIAAVVSFVLLVQCNVQAQANKAISKQVNPKASTSTGKLTFAQLHEMVTDLSGQKYSSVNGLQDSETPRLIKLDFNSPFNWHGDIAMAAKNDNYIYVIFPCRKIDLKDNREEYTQRLLAKNSDLGLMRFEIDSHDMVKLVLPLANQGMTAEKLNRCIQSLLDTAKSTSDVWSNKPVRTAGDMPSGSAPASGPSASVGTVPTEGSSPSAGTVPHQASLKISNRDICKDGNMRIGTMSIKDSSSFGTIMFGPDGSFAGFITNREGTANNKDKGTWKIVDGQLELTIGTGDKILFETKSNKNGKLKLQTSDGAMAITLA